MDSYVKTGDDGDGDDGDGDRNYFRRELQLFGSRLGPFTGEVLLAVNSGRLSKLELRYRAKLQCVNQTRDEWSGPDETVILTFGGAAKAARRSFETRLVRREGDHAALVANYRKGKLIDFHYIGKER